jgi:GTP 3',8-cyclase
MSLTDQHGRSIHKLRLSLIDACNMRCPYCMPEHPEFLKQHELMTPEEISLLVQELNKMGIRELRLTGGEPLLRQDFLEIAHRVSAITFESIGLTTNATRLMPILPELKKTRIKNLNISLDSLQRQTFKAMSGVDALENVLTAIFSAKEMGFHIKINVVVMRGINHQEILDFVEFSREHQIPVRFLELMKIGVMASDQSRHYFVSQKEMQSIISQQSHLIPVKSPRDATSQNFMTDNGAQIGFIASETNEFCQGCSRLRVDAKGKVYPCLFSDQGISLKNKSENQLLEILNLVINQKPLHRIDHVDRPMHMIGG